MNELMKKLKRLIYEEVEKIILESDASKEAKSKGLEHVGFGRYSKNGKVVAQSRNGKLIAVGKKDDTSTKSKADFKKKDYTETKKQFYKKEPYLPTASLNNFSTDIARHLYNTDKDKWQKYMNSTKNMEKDLEKKFISQYNSNPKFKKDIKNRGNKAPAYIEKIMKGWVEDYLKEKNFNLKNNG